MKKIVKKIVRQISCGILSIFPPNKFPVPIVIVKQYLIYNIEKRNFEEVKKYCIYLSEIDDLNEGLKKIAAYFFCKVHTDISPNADVLKKLRTQSQIKANLSVEYLERNEIEESLVQFDKSLGNLGLEKDIKDIWMKSFKTLAFFYTGNSNSTPPAESSDIEYSEINWKPIEKIIVSGMLWSGSGALYDFFREFDSIGALKGEQRLWKGKQYGLNHIAENLDSLSEYKKNLMKFFTIPLSGMFPAENWQETIAAEAALNFIRSDRKGVYALAGSRFIETLVSMVKNGTPDYKIFVQESAKYADSMINALIGHDHRYALLDNAIHPGNIEAFNLFGNASVFCVFRDPRSNYVSRYYENPRFNSDPDDYIEYYLKTRNRFNDRIKNRVNNPERVYPVQFEKFILSEEYRLSLAKDLDLDLSVWRKHKYFKPHVSEKNVFNYRSFHNQKVIKKIEKSLEEYCVDWS